MAIPTPPVLTSAPPARPGHGWGWITPGLLATVLRLADLAVVALTGLTAHLVRAGEAPFPALLGFAIVCACLMALDLFAAAGIYGLRELGCPRAQAGRIALAWTVVPLLLWLLALAVDRAGDLPAALFLVWWALGLAVLLALHLLVALVAGRGQRAGWLATRLVLVGAGPQAAHLVRHVRQHGPAIRVLGIFDDRRTRIPDAVEGCPVLGTLDDLAAFAHAERVDQVIIALPQQAAVRRLACFEKLRHLPIDVRLSPDLPDLELGARGAAELAGLPLLRVFDRPLAGWGRLVKGLEDRLLAASVLILAAPVMLAIAILVRLDTPGPALYRQERFGFDNRPIRVLKFRTMYRDRCDAADGAITSARPGDPRVTPAGRILRATSLDELPLLLYVLKGEMSIVGPRPHASAQNERFATLIDGYLARHRVKPGITGWAQVNGLRGEADTLARMQDRVRYDLHYIENWSLLLDLRIILRTLLVGFSHPNAY
jgi:putative colanic acid biosynthesis UDP-glucose lipid carrier transferase